MFWFNRNLASQMAGVVEFSFTGLLAGAISRWDMDLLQVLDSSQKTEKLLQQNV